LLAELLKGNFTAMSAGGHPELLGLCDGHRSVLCDTALSLVRSWYSDTNLQPPAGGLPLDCSDEQFEQIVKEVQPMDDKIVNDMEQ